MPRPSDHGSYQLDNPDTGTVITVEAGTTASEFNAMLASAGEGTTFVLQGGNHVFTETVLVTRDNITIMGEEGADVTVTFDFPDGQGGHGFEVAGQNPTYAGALRADASAGDTEITLQSSHQVAAGDVIYLFQPNTQEYLDANGWDNVSFEDADSRPFREFIVEVESVNGSVITLKDPLPYDLARTETRCFEQDLVDGFSMSGLTITFDLGETDPYDFTNSYPEYTQTYALFLNGTSGADVQNLEFIDVASTAMCLSNTIHASVDNILIDGTHNLGGGGNGYGILLSEAFNNDLSNLTIESMRHSFILSAWNAETGNTVHILFSDRDINFHGSPDTGNSVVVDQIILDHDVANGGYVGPLIGGAASNHPETDISANEIGFNLAVGLDYADTFWGTGTSDHLDGGGGNDVIDGKAGDDTIIGGAGDDVLTGGTGKDVFVFRTGSGHDAITDFGISEGDRIDLSDFGFQNFNDLATVTQQTADGVLLSLDGGSLLIEGVAFSDLGNNDFIF